jgi:hypothetical protein
MNPIRALRVADCGRAANCFASSFDRIPTLRSCFDIMIPFLTADYADGADI